MKKTFLLVALLSGAIFASLADADEDQAGPTQDLTPTALNFSRVGGEFGVGQVVQIVLRVKNVGTLPVRGRGGIRVGSVVLPNSGLYGPNGVGGYSLGAQIRPGEFGQFLVYAPLGTVRHCQSTRVYIDTAQSLQSGPSIVFYNDSKALTARERGQLKACVGGLKP